MSEHEPTLQHFSPKEHIRGPFHLWELYEGERIIGYARAWYMNKPFPLYYISDLKIVEKDARGKGYGSQLLETLNAQIKKRDAVGMLMDNTAAVFNTENDARVVGMYERHGWVQIEEPAMFNTVWLAYNIPSAMKSDDGRFKQAIKHITNSAGYRIGV